MKIQRYIESKLPNKSDLYSVINILHVHGNQSEIIVLFTDIRFMIYIFKVICILISFFSLHVGISLFKGKSL